MKGVLRVHDTFRYPPMGRGSIACAARPEITAPDDVRVPGALQQDAFLRHVAVQTRDREKGGVCYGPGSAAHHERARRRALTKARSRASSRAMGLMLRCARDT